MKQKILVTAVLVAGIFLGMVQAAQAQTESDNSSDRSGRIKIILGQPADGDTKHVLGTPVLGFGAGYDIPQSTSKKNPSFVPATGIEYITKSHTKDGVRVNLSYIGLIAEGRYFLGSETKTTGFGVKTRTPTGFYTGLGTGVYYLKYRREEGGVSKDDVSGIKFGLKFLGGFQFKNGIYIEGDYTKPGSSHATMYNLNIGFRVASNVGGN
ncbi:MAG: hypothetical protein WCP07_01180 [bacterium]